MKDDKLVEDPFWDEKHNEEGFEVLSMMSAMASFKQHLKKEVEPSKLSRNEMFAELMFGRPNIQREQARTKLSSSTQHLCSC